ncbi:MAG: serine/threonine protein kinase [Actinomycetota bacterium]|nr:serine/threonine protein kinase [Actinomycetota bacterium]
MGELFAGRYELVDPLGSGGMGSIWRCWDHRAGTYLAAKVLRQSDASSLMRFVREQSYRVRHPHVVTPLGWAGEDDRLLFTMPIVRGGSVATLLGDFGRLPSGWVVTLVDQLLDALAAVHAIGLVHRDVKSANLLLQPTGRARPHLLLSDFGIAAVVGEPRLTRVSDVVGTPGYFAPEQLRGAGPDPRQDLYGVGIVAAEMLTGLSPAREVHVGGEAPDGCPAALWRLASALAAHHPDDRPASADRAREALAAASAPHGWPPSPAGDVEVFDQMPPLPPGWSAAGPCRLTAPATTTAPSPTRPADAVRTRFAVAVVLIVLGIALMALAAILLATSSG